MVCEVKKIDSNSTGLRYAEEECIGELPVTPVWYGQEPNSYNDFGGQYTMVARNPINASRQRKKGSITDLEASGGYTQDVTDYNLTRLMQGFLFADARQKATLKPFNGAQVLAGAVTSADDTYAVASGGTAFVANRLVLASGYGVSANNGLRTVVSSTATTVVVSQALTDEAAPPASANLSVVGHQFASGDLSIVMVGGLPALTSAAVDMTTLGLFPGEWIFVGGDATATQFTSQIGAARVASISTTQLVLDKVGWATPAADAGTGKTIQLFFGTLIRNESDPMLIKRRSYDLERTLGQDANGIQSEHLIGAVPSEFTLTVNQAELVTCDFTFVAIDHQTRTGAEGLAAGDRPDIPANMDAFNTSSDFSRIKLASVTPGNAVPAPLFAFATELTVTINNNLSANKAIGVLGAMEVSAGTFEVGGSATVYFADVEATRAVRNNADVTLDILMVKKNAGLLFDIPLLTLGDGRATVEQDQPIMLPLETAAAESAFGNTLTYMSFPYLPSIAE